MVRFRSYLERFFALQLLIRTLLFDKKAPPLGGAFFLVHFWGMRNLVLFVFTMLVLVRCGAPEQPTKTPDVNTSESIAVSIKDPIDSINNVLRDAPNDLDALEYRASLYLKRQNLKYAAADVAAVLEMDSSRTKALELWGDISFATNQTRQSRDAWVRCMKEDPNYVPCRLKMAQLYHVVTEFEKSAALVDEVLEMEPSNAEAAYLKGLLMRDALEDTTRALDWFQKAIDLKPDYIEALDMSGVLYSSLGNPLALGYFNRLIELQPDIRVHFYNRGMFYLSQQNWNGALEDFTKCTQLDPQDLESFFNIGYVHLQLQLYAEARQYFTQALAIQPVNHRALYGRGYCFELLGDLPNAEADYRQALSFNPQHRGSQEGLGRIERARAQSGQ